MIGMANESRKPIICVMMSTYNGEEYIEEQVESIYAQEDVSICLYVRDDGSNDGTVDQLLYLQRFYNEKGMIFELEIGPRMGYPDTFYSLLGTVEDKYDYYAYADQDDYWLPRKIVEGVNVLEKETYRNRPLLYCTNTTITDSRLNVISDNDLNNLIVALPSFFMRARVAAHTMVFNNKLREQVVLISGMHHGFGHDVINLLVCIACDGVVKVGKSNVLHRRHSKALSSGGKGIIDRIRTEMKTIFFSPLDRQGMAEELLTHFAETLSDEDKHFLSQCSKLDTSFTAKLNLLKNNRLNCGINAVNIKSRIAIILGKF